VLKIEKNHFLLSVTNSYAFREAMMLLWIRLGSLILAFLTWISCVPDASRQIKEKPSKIETNYYYHAKTKVPFDYSEEFFLVVLQNLREEDRKKVIQALDQTGIRRANVLGNEIYIQTDSPEAANALVAQLVDLGFEIQSYFPAIGAGRTLAFINDMVVVKLQKGKNLQAFMDYLEQRGATVLEHYKIGRTYYIIARTPPGNAPFGLANQIQEDDWSILSQPNFKLFSHALYTPNDARFADQRAMPVMELPAAWNLTRGSSDIAVAVLDSGFDLDHPDLQNNIIAPYDALRNDSNPETESEKDKHGTPVLGIIAADTDNSIGVAGIGFNIKAVPVKIAVTDSCIIFGDECMITECAAIVRAADHLINTSSLNVAAVNNSYLMHDDQKEDCWLEALSDMRQLTRGGLGAAIIAGTGNDGDEVRSGYPVKFPMVIGVGELNLNGWVNSNSNFGEFADIVAPGSWFTTDLRGADGFSDEDYAYFSGTSAASPAVAAVAGLIASVNPQLTGEDIGKILLHSADLLLDRYAFSPFSSHITGLKHEKAGFGRVNALQAVQMASREQIPENVYPVLYTLEPLGNSVLHYLDKEPGRNFPGSSELDLYRIPSWPATTEGVYLTRYFQIEGRNLLYSAGATSETIQRLDMLSGLGPIVYEQTFGEFKPDQVFIYPGDPPKMIKYYRANGTEEVYQIVVDESTNSILLEKIQEHQLAQENTIEYAYIEEPNEQRIARFSRLNCMLDFISVGSDGMLESIVGSHQFDINTCPDLFTIYRGASSYFMYTQTSPFEYTISKLSVDGDIEHQETHSSAFSDTPFDHLAVHHTYEQSRPIFIFWDSRGAIKVKALISDFQLNPFAINIKQFLSGLDPTIPRWPSSTMVQY
jgi:subtilisin family serine protease